MPSSSASSACSGTRDWMKIVARVGLMPAASQSTNISQTLSAIDLRAVEMRGERVPVGGEVQAFVLLLQLHPVLERAVVVADVHAGRSGACPTARGRQTCDVTKPRIVEPSSA